MLMRKKLVLAFTISVISVISFTINAQTVNTFTFNINGSPIPAGLVAGLNNAAERWNKHVIIIVPIKVNIFLVNSPFIPFSGFTLANGRTNFVNTPVSNFIYPTALANQLAGTELNSGEYDMDIYINLARSFYYGTAKPSASEQDFITFMMHEIGHGLGFYSAGYVDANNIGSFGNVPQSAISPITTSFPGMDRMGFPLFMIDLLLKNLSIIW